MASSTNKFGVKWQAGPVMVIPQGSDMSFTRARILEDRIKEMGGTIARNAKDADVVIVPNGFPAERLRREFLKDRFDAVAKMSIDWITEAIKGRWTNPRDNGNPYRWMEEGHPTVSSSSSSSSTSSMSAKAAARVTAALSKLETLQRDDERREDGDSSRTHSEQSKDDDSDVHDVDGNSHLQKGSSNKNALLVSELSRMGELCSAQGDKWRAKSYNQAAAIIRALDFEVTDTSLIRHRKGIGPKMERHIDEILQTGKYAKRETLEHNPETASSVELMKIFGVGKAWAKRLFHLGYPTVESIRNGLNNGDPKLAILSRNQLIGVRLYEELNERIPRWEIERLRDKIKSVAKLAYPLHISSELIVEAVGSYRRGKQSCGDCDILLSLPTHPNRRVSLIPLVKLLEQSGFVTNKLSHATTANPIGDAAEEPDLVVSRPHEIVDHDFLIAPVNEEQEMESETFMGICMLPPSEGGSGIHHRIDLKSYAYKSYPFALLYFTGSALFSRNMRDYAQKKKALKLTDRGLYPSLSDSSTSTMHAIPCDNEQDIFRALGLYFTEPENRNYDELFPMPSQEEQDRFDESKRKVLQRRLEAKQQGGSGVSHSLANKVKLDMEAAAGFGKAHVEPEEKKPRILPTTYRPPISSNSSKTWDDEWH